MRTSYNGRRADLARFLRRLPKMLSGDLPDETGGGVRALLTRVGMVALAIIRDAYVTKARGGTDASGMKWQPLSPRTIAYRRRHPGLKRDTTGQYRPSSMLTTGERAYWWSLYKQRLRQFDGDKSHAAASAWRVLLAAGARTILSVYGKVEVEILRDTGRLINSLSPGVVSTDQIFRLGRGSVTVGTNVKYAAAHHFGTGRIPRRRLWPDWNDWPNEWKAEIHDAIRDGIADLIMRWLSTGT